MVAGLFEVGWVKVFVEGSTPAEAFLRLDKVQNLYCLCNMSRNMGTEEDEKVADQLEEILDKCDVWADTSLSFEEFRAIDLPFSIGGLKCFMSAEGEDAIATLKEVVKQQFPDVWW